MKNIRAMTLHYQNEEPAYLMGHSVRWVDIINSIDVVTRVEIGLPACFAGMGKVEMIYVIMMDGRTIDIVALDKEQYIKRMNGYVVLTIKGSEDDPVVIYRTDPSDIENNKKASEKTDDLALVFENCEKIIIPKDVLLGFSIDSIRKRVYGNRGEIYKDFSCEHFTLSLDKKAYLNGSLHKHIEVYKDISGVCFRGQTIYVPWGEYDEQTNTNMDVMDEGDSVRIEISNINN